MTYSSSVHEHNNNTVFFSDNPNLQETLFLHIYFVVENLIMFQSVRVAVSFIVALLVSKMVGSLYGTSVDHDRDIEHTIGELNRRIAGLQVQRSHAYVPPVFWAKDRGVYESNIRINTYGKPWIAGFRQVGVFDNNAFATAWVTICLLEAGQYGKGAPVPGDEPMKRALELINSHHDKNSPPGNGAVDFWPQTLNHSSGLWVSQPTNIISIISLLDDDLPWDLIEKVCSILGPSSEVCELLKFLQGARQELFPAFKIPADFDDTFVNIGLGSLLKQLSKRYPVLYQLWESNNTNTDSAFELLKTYAYRPLSDDLANVIDPRTYYYAHGFLEKANDEGKPVSLVTTWIQNLTEERVRHNEGVSMPFNINNVDSTVAANVIYGVNAALLENMFETKTWFDADTRMVYENTTSFIAWVIESGTMTSRPDLALTYYPSRYNFYWFVARTRFLIANRIARGDLPAFPSLRLVYEQLNEVLQSRVTTDILAEAKTEGGKWAYFDDFLGGADETWEGKPKNSADDRLFTTSMAVNTLIATWTTQDEVTGQLTWAKDTPVDVIRVVDQAVSWLAEFILSDDYKPLNAFFSGSVKGTSTMPFYYPINFLEYVNGTKIPLNDTHIDLDSSVVLAMSGVVPHEQYKKMVQEPHFGHQTPTEFPGYSNSVFPFWSSAAYTYASTLLTLSQFLNLAT
ncbi:uncharacterized protein LOC119730137 [Patiria miniata]|uniref:Uncharacterized protein n=1 Tax=Patiria miniata TaxID=46514 RepID=A0A914A610_PATMI|nr:uncharacterized protein LOC119730137 [Patiria miniata]